MCSERQPIVRGCNLVLSGAIDQYNARSRGISKLY
jgi:hypothetical protein